MKNIIHPKTSIIAFVLIFAFLLTACGSPKESVQNDKEETKLTDLSDSKIGLVTGTMTALLVPDILPDADYQEFNSISDVVMALDTGKIDAYPADESLYLAALWENQNVDRIDEPLAISDYGVIFGKNKNVELQAQFNDFLAQCGENGVLETYEEKWFSTSEPTDFLSYESLEGSNGILKIGICSSTKPFVYLKNGLYTGFDIEILTLFAESYGYELVFEDTQFGSILTGVVMGTYDIGVSGFTITEERAQSVDFSQVYHTEDLVMVIAGETTGTQGFWASLKESFEKTFIREERWKLIVEGIFITAIISLFAVLGGTIMGFLLYLATKARNKMISNITNRIVNVYSRIIAGTPTLVILMLLYYVVFGKVDISGIVVAVIGFILIFASFVVGQLNLTVEGIDKGQTEAAYALGYDRNHTFFRIILPQAMWMFVPVYASEVVSLIKATSVVGYIAVNDLTKMGDIIRSSTYEAFFPLISVAVIYFIITWFVTKLLDIVKYKIDPKKRENKDILKGVVR